MQFLFEGGSGQDITFQAEIFYLCLAVSLSSFLCLFSDRPSMLGCSYLIAGPKWSMVFHLVEDILLVLWQYRPVCGFHLRDGDRWQDIAFLAGIFQAYFVSYPGIAQLCPVCLLSPGSILISHSWSMVSHLGEDTKDVIASKIF